MKGQNVLVTTRRQPTVKFRKMSIAIAALTLQAILLTSVAMGAPLAGTCGSHPELAIYIANDPLAILRFEHWLGRPVDAIQVFGGQTSWEDLSGSLSWVATRLRSATADVRWSIPLIPKGATLAEAARGDYDARYTALAQQFTKKYGKSKTIHIRVGWEFNGKNWNPWSAVGRASEYIGAYRSFVRAFRKVSENFTFEWTPNIGRTDMNPEEAYPGDEFVDIIGLDFYYNWRWLPSDPLVAWDIYLKEPYGLEWHQKFANAHHKPTAYPEWGVNSDSAGPFIERAALWFCEHDVIYQSYWDSNEAFAGQLSNNQYPNAARAYRASFGRASPRAGT